MELELRFENYNFKNCCRQLNYYYENKVTDFEAYEDYLPHCPDFMHYPEYIQSCKKYVSVLNKEHITKYEKNFWGYFFDFDFGYIKNAKKSSVQNKSYVLQNFKNIASKRKKTIKKLDEFFAKKDNLTDAEFGKEFLKVFYGSPVKSMPWFWNVEEDVKIEIYKKHGFDHYVGIDPEDDVFAEVLTKFKNHKTQMIKSNFRDTFEVTPWDVNWDYFTNRYNAVNFEVLSDIELDKDKIYTKQEIDDMLEKKQIVLLNITGRYEKAYEDDENYKMFNDFESAYNPYLYWWAQPIASNILRNSKKINDQMQTLAKNYKKETETIKKEMFKTMIQNFQFQNFYKNQKAYVDKKSNDNMQKEIERHNKQLEKEEKIHKQNVENIEKFENSFDELKKEIEDFVL